MVHKVIPPCLKPAATVKNTLDSTVMRFNIQKRPLYSGIVQVTLFSPTAEPLSERLLFVQNPDLLKLDITANKESYKPREKIQFSLNARNKYSLPAGGSFSVSVTDESKVKIDENTESTILTNLLLTSDLKGYVEQPNYYFANNTDSTRAALDVLMLTLGYRRFGWKQLLNNSTVVKYQPEKTLEIAGTVKILYGKPVSHGNVILIAAMGGPTLSRESDKYGAFHFSNLMFMDTTRFILQATNAKGKNNTEITYDQGADVPPVTGGYLSMLTRDVNAGMAVYLNNTKIQQVNSSRLGSIKGVLLKEVKIKRSKNLFPSQRLPGAGYPDQVVNANEIPTDKKLSLSLIPKLRGFLAINGLFYLSNDFPNTKPAKIYNDGVEGLIDDIPPEDIETIEVIKEIFNVGINAEKGGGSILLITRKHNYHNRFIKSYGILPIMAKGFYKAREFYSPSYNPIDLVTQHTDLRSTIFWKPDLVTDKEGNTSFEYYNAEVIGTYQVIVEGIDNKGNIGRKVLRYKVE